MRTWKRWVALGMLGLALGLSGCGFGGAEQEEDESEQVLPGQGGEDDEGGPRPQDLSISIGRSCYHTPQPSLGHRSDLHSNEEGFHVFGRDHGLVQPKGFVLEAFQ